MDLQCVLVSCIATSLNVGDIRGSDSVTIQLLKFISKLLHRLIWLDCGLEGEFHRSAEVFAGCIQEKLNVFPTTIAPIHHSLQDDFSVIRINASFVYIIEIKSLEKCLERLKDGVFIFFHGSTLTCKLFLLFQRGYHRANMCTADFFHSRLFHSDFRVNDIDIERSCVLCVCLLDNFPSLIALVSFRPLHQEVFAFDVIVNKIMGHLLSSPTRG